MGFPGKPKPSSRRRIGQVRLAVTREEDLLLLRCASVSSSTKELSPRVETTPINVSRWWTCSYGRHGQRKGQCFVQPGQSHVDVVIQHGPGCAPQLSITQGGALASESCSHKERRPSSTSVSICVQQPQRVVTQNGNHPRQYLMMVNIPCEAQCWCRIEVLPLL